MVDIFRSEPRKADFSKISLGDGDLGFIENLSLMDDVSRSMNADAAISAQYSNIARKFSDEEDEIVDPIQASKEHPDLELTIKEPISRARLNALAEVSKKRRAILNVLSTQEGFLNKSAQLIGAFSGAVGLTDVGITVGLGMLIGSTGPVGAAAGGAKAVQSGSRLLRGFNNARNLLRISKLKTSADIAKRARQAAVINTIEAGITSGLLEYSETDLDTDFTAGDHALNFGIAAGLGAGVSVVGDLIRLKRANRVSRGFRGSGDIDEDEAIDAVKAQILADKTPNVDPLMRDKAASKGYVPDVEVGTRFDTANPLDGEFFVASKKRGEGFPIDDGDASHRVTDDLGVGVQGVSVEGVAARLFDGEDGAVLRTKFKKAPRIIQDLDAPPRPEVMGALSDLFTKLSGTKFGSRSLDSLVEEKSFREIYEALVRSDKLTPEILEDFKQSLKDNGVDALIERHTFVKFDENGKAVKTMDGGDVEIDSDILTIINDEIVEVLDELDPNNTKVTRNAKDVNEDIEEAILSDKNNIGRDEDLDSLKRETPSKGPSESEDMADLRKQFDDMKKNLGDDDASREILRKAEELDLLDKVSERLTRCIRG